MKLSTLTAVSPIDGRYHQTTESLSQYWSEAALIRNRIQIEVDYLLSLADKQVIPPFSAAEKKQLLKLCKNISDEDVASVKEIEAITHHDVKAVEYFLRKQFLQKGISHEQYLHIALTSDDVNSLAHALSLRESLHEILIPLLDDLVHALTTMADNYASVPMLARTHGQPAVPTTFGKEMIVFALRLHTEKQRLASLAIEAKLSGAVGNWNAHVAAFPTVDWMQFSTDCIQSYGLEPNLYATQIVPADSEIRVFQSLQLLNTVLIGFCQDMWRYISDGYLVQEKKKQEIGSSTMPQKINPIHFENAEGNLGLANALFTHYVQKLPISRLQRDLTDSTVKRTIGTAFSHCVIAYSSLLTGLSRVQVDESRMRSELELHPESVAEGIQTVLRSHGHTKAYEQLTELTRGEHVDSQKLRDFVQALPVDAQTKQQLLTINTTTYLGLAVKVVRKGSQHIQRKKRSAHDKA